jgi:RNA polymerase sigma-70 factor (ECF subfamily)
MTTNNDWIAVEFEASRARLVGLAYRMLGSHAEAEDAVQESWLRLRNADSARIENMGGFLTTLVGRECLDRLRARNRRREEPHETGSLEAVDGADPAGEALLADSVGAALMIVLELLSPAERVAFVLHDVFAVPFDEVGEILERSPDAARQLASRARRRVQDSAPTTDVDFVRHREVVDAFLRAARGGDFDALMQLLDPDVVLTPDAAAVGMGSLRETLGAPDVAAALSGGAQGARLAIIDGVAGFVWMPGGHLRGVVEFALRGDKIVAINVTGNQERIAAFDVVPLD